MQSGKKDTVGPLEQVFIFCILLVFMAEAFLDYI